MLAAIKLIRDKWETTTPNIVTLARLLVCILGLIWFYLIYFQPLLLIGMLAISAALDWLDGFLARILNEHSESGMLLDPLVDKICGWVTFAAVADYFVYHTSITVAIFFLLCTPFAILIGTYDLMTMKMRSADDKMRTNDVAKAKQLVLFVALGFYLVAIGFHDAREIEYVWPFTAAFELFTFLGFAFLWHTARMCITSVRTYQKESRNPEVEARMNTWWARALFAIVEPF